MMNWTKIRAVLLLPILLLTGCATTERSLDGFFWPPAPNDPKIEYIATYSSQLDFPVKNSLSDTLTGSDEEMAFLNPIGIASNGNGLVYITDAGLVSVVVYDLKNNKITTIGEQGMFHAPYGIAMDREGRIFVTDSQKNMVFVFDALAKPMFNLGKDRLNWPTGVAVNDDLKRVYVLNNRGHNVDVFDITGKHLFSFGGMGNGEGKLLFPTGIAVNSKGNVIIADSMNALVQVFDQDGRFLYQFGNRGDALMDFQHIKGIAVDSEDQIYVTDNKADRMLVFSEKGEPLTWFTGRFYIPKWYDGWAPDGFVLPNGIAIDKNNTIYLVDTWNKRFHIYQYLGTESLKKKPEPSSR